MSETGAVSKPRKGIMHCRGRLCLAHEWCHCRCEACVEAGGGYAMITAEEFTEHWVDYEMPGMGCPDCIALRKREERIHARRAETKEAGR